MISLGGLDLLDDYILHLGFKFCEPNDLKKYVSESPFFKLWIISASPNYPNPMCFLNFGANRKTIFKII